MRTQTPKDILISSDIVIDFDIGLMRVIKEKYNNEKMVNHNILYLDDKLLKYELLYRTNYNPLSIILNDNYNSSMETLYSQFMEREYELILKYSGITDTIYAIAGWIVLAKTNVTILCKNEDEKEKIITSIAGNKDAKPISFNFAIGKLEDIDIPYDVILLKSYKDLDPNKIKCNIVYLADYVFNCIANKDARLVIEPLLDNIDVRYIGVYNANSIEQIIG